MYLNETEKWNAILDRVKKGVRGIFPIEGKTGKIELLNVDIPNKVQATIDSQKTTLLQSKSLATPVYGEFRLTRNGKSETARIKILDLPILTNRGTFIVQGKDYAVFNQVRLKPGVYVRRVPDSDEVFADFNLGKGLGFNLEMDNNGVFYIRFDKSKLSASSHRLHLYPLVKALGASEGEIKTAWGAAYDNNINKVNEAETLKSIVETCIYPTKRTGNDVKDLKDYFAGNELNEETTKVTIGVPTKAVTYRSLLAATSKLVKVYNNKEEEDDLDSLLFKEVLGVEDHLMLRIEKKSKEEGILYKVQNRIDQGYPLKSIILPNFLTKLVEGFFTKSTLSAPQSEINPIEILETGHKITPMGEGGIGSDRAIPMSARNLHPSHLGYIDPLRTAESTRVGVDLRTSLGTTIKDRNIYTTYIDRQGKKVQLKPMDLVGKVIGFPNQELKKQVRALKGNHMVEVPRDKVDYWVPKSSEMFTVTTNLVPFLHNDQGNRVNMASRMVTQAVPLVHREAPLVQIRDQSGKYETLQERYGKDYFVPKSPIDGTVTEVTSKYIKVNNEKVEIYDNFPLNLKCPSGKMRVNILKVTGKIWRGQVKDYTWNIGDCIQSINPETKTSSWERINAFDWQNNDKTLFNIKFRSGRNIVVTEDHSLMTIDKNGDLTPIFPKDCVERQTKCPVATIPTIQGTGVVDARDDYYHGVFVGLYLSEGCVNNTCIKISVSEEDAKREVEHILNTVATKNKAHVYIDSVRLYDQELSAWLVSTFGKYAHGKYIATEVFSWSREFRLGLIQGYMAGDGCISHYEQNSNLPVSHFTVRGASVSKQLRDDLVDMLASLGVFTTICESHLSDKNAAWKDAFLFTIPVRELPDWNLFYYKKRQERLDGLKKKLSETSGSRYVLPASYYKPMPEHVQKRWKASDVRWDTIEAITEAPHEDLVYDFEVDQSNAFAVEGGLVIHNTFLTMYPTVKVGDKVKKGQVLADSNFTKDGQLAIGTNLNVAYVPYKGYTHEDSIVISESTAEKLTSQHMYISEFEINAESYLDKASYIKWLPTKINGENIRKLDEQGVVKKGEKVRRGDVLIAGLRRKTLTSADAMMRKLKGSLVNPYKDAAETWEHDAEGTVVDVIKSPKLIRVVVTTEDKAKQGDKLSGLHGNKGTIGLILPDSEMPVDKDGKPVDAMFNPASVPSRVNPGQLYEAMEGKRAKQLGHRVIVDNFDPADSSQKVLAKMKRDNVKPEEELFDPKTGKSIGNIMVGTPYIIKLHKQTEGNFSALNRGAFDINNQPIKGGEEGAKGVGLLDVYALLGHNARNNLREMATYKSDRNDDFWNALEAGITPTNPKEPFAFKKFKSIVTASGIGIKEDKDNLTIAPLTDKDILAKSRGAIQKGAILENHMGKDRPEKGGIFDPVVTGGMEGQNWSHINLAQPIINPLFEGVVETLLHKSTVGMNVKDVQKELAAINVTKRIGEISAALKVATGSNRNKLLKELKYLTALKQSGRSPADYVLTKFPIIPPAFRPVFNSQTGGLPMVSDVNYLYKDMLNVNEKLNEMKNFPDSEKAALTKDLRQSAHALVGLMAPVNKANEKRGVTGFLPQLTGSNYNGVGTSKESFFHRKILKRQQMLTGRGTILPEPDMSVDNVKIPWDMAWTVYEPFIIANLRKRGLNILKAKEEVKNKTMVAKQILEQEMQKRPVLINRAPTLHKYNIMALKPLGTEGKSILVPPLIIKGFAADFDGDSVAGDTRVLVRTNKGNIRLKKIKDVRNVKPKTK